MHGNAKKAAVNKFAQLKEFNDVDLLDAILKDDKGFTEDEAKEILEAIRTEIGGAPRQPSVDHGMATSKPKELHPAYRWYDKWNVKIAMREVFNPHTQKPMTIILGWTLQRIMKKVAIEPLNAVGLNHFCDSIGPTDAGGAMLLPSDEYKAGDKITFRQWSRMQGIPEKKIKANQNIVGLEYDELEEGQF